MEYKADHAAVVSALRAIVSESQIVEVRALQVPGDDGIKRNYSGFFDDITLLASAGVQLSDAGAKGWPPPARYVLYCFKAFSPEYVVGATYHGLVASAGAPCW